MKQRVYTGLILVLFLAAISCSRYENYTPTTEESKVIKITASINNNSTKTELGLWDEELQEYPLLWSYGDAIAIVNNGKIFKFELDAESDKSSIGKFSCKNSEGFDETKPIQAFYPFEESVSYPPKGISIVDGEINYTIPKVQYHYDNTFYRSAALMAAYTENASQTLAFDNLFGILKLQVLGTSSEKLRSIEVTNLSGLAMSGPSIVNIGNENYVTFTSKEFSDRRVRVELGEGLTLSSADPTTFHIVIPPGLHEWSIKFTTEGHTYYKSTTSLKTITAGNILKMPVVDLNSSDVIVPTENSYFENDVYYGEGITLPSKNNMVPDLLWAPVNCGYEKRCGEPDYSTSPTTPAPYPGFLYGKLFQWGRKDGVGYYDFNNPFWEFEHHYIPTVDEGSGVSNTELNTFYMQWNPSNWEGNPCPTGWRVPTTAELESTLPSDSETYSYYWSGLGVKYGMYLTGKTPIQKNEDGTPSVPFIALQLSGAMYIDENGNVEPNENRNHGGYYWTYDEPTEQKAISLVVGFGSRIEFEYAPVTQARAIRCVKN